MTKLEELSAHRLSGEQVPRDLAVLVPHADELKRRCGIHIGYERDWAPWADKSYLTERDLSDPAIRANDKAHDMVLPYIAFFAAHKDREYLGYWRGPSMRPIAKSPLVWLNNEGQYSLYPLNVTVAYIIADHSSASGKSWLESLNVGVYEQRVIDGAEDEPDPDELHGVFYTKLVSSSD